MRQHRSAQLCCTQQMNERHPSHTVAARRRKNHLKLERDTAGEKVRLRAHYVVMPPCRCSRARIQSSCTRQLCASGVQRASATAAEPPRFGGGSTPSSMQSAFLPCAAVAKRASSPVTAAAMSGVACCGMGSSSNRRVARQVPSRKFVAIGAWGSKRKAWSRPTITLRRATPHAGCEKGRRTRARRQGQTRGA